MRSTTGRALSLRGTFISSGEKKSPGKKKDEDKKIPGYVMDEVNAYPDEVRAFARGPLGDLSRMELSRVIERRNPWDIERLAARYGKTEELINQALDFLQLVRKI